MKIQLKRAYEPADKRDGLRLLVERLWPRGLTKEKAGIDEQVAAILTNLLIRTYPDTNCSEVNSRKNRFNSGLRKLRFYFNANALNRDTPSPLPPPRGGRVRERVTSQDLLRLG